MDDSEHHDARIYGRGEAVLAVTIIAILLCTLFVFLRTLSRIAIVKKVAWDDYLILLAWVIAVAMSFSICYGTMYGLGRHETDVPKRWQSTLRKASFAFSILYQPALMTTKTSILAFYLTFSTADHIFRYGCYATLVVVNAGGLALTLVAVFQCHPISSLFRSVMSPDATCTDILTIYLASVPLNIITDLAILFLPMPVLTSMRLPRKQKIILLVTFSFGIFVAVVDILRVSYLQSASESRLAQVATNNTTDSPHATDSSFYLAFLFMWSAIEVTMGIMCACVPGLKPLVARFLPHMLRDPADGSSSFASPSTVHGEAERAASLIPEVPEHAHCRDFGRRLPSAGEEQGDDRSMSMTEFLAVPGVHDGESNPMERSLTAVTNTSRHTAPEHPTIFGFVDMRQMKSAAHMTSRESIYPVAVVTVLFFIWGFEYGLLDVLNQQFQSVANVTTAQAVGIRSAYYCGYLVGPLTMGRLVLKHWGFKACFPVGLSIYAAGCLIFWPAAILTSWPTFLVTNFIIGFGLSILEVSANAFISLCGPARSAEIRLNLSQGVQAIGSVVAPLIAERAYLHKTLHAPSLVNTQWAYLGISLATVMLAVAYFYIPLPEATDEELEDAAERLDGANETSLGNARLIWYILALGVFSQFCYVGAQEVIGGGYGLYLATTMPDYSTSEYYASNQYAIAHTAFAASRFLAAGLGFWIKPRVMLLALYVGAIIFTALSTKYTGDTGVALVVMTFFCEGPLFALIFAQSLRGQGRHTKLASVLLTASVGGGGVFAPIATVIATSGTSSIPHSFVVAVAAFAGGSVFALALNLSPQARRVVDPIRDHASSSSLTPRCAARRASRRLSILALCKNYRPPSTAVEYRERKLSVGTSDAT